MFFDLNAVPRNNVTNKVNDLVSRVRRVKVQALLLNELRKEMPKMTGRERKQKELIATLEEVFFKVSKAHNVPPGDFPDVVHFRHSPLRGALG